MSMTNSTFSPEEKVEPTQEAYPSWYSWVSPMKDWSEWAKFYIVTFVSGLWIIYLTFYNSRLFGWLISKYFAFKGQSISFASFSVNLLGGKIMFRNFRYGCSDYTVTVNDGFLIFRWWLPHPIVAPETNQQKSKERNRRSKKTSRVYIQLSGCDWNYFYNESVHGNGEAQPTEQSVSKIWDEIWDLCPYFEINVLYGRIIMGNKTLPNSLVCSLSEGMFQYRKPDKKLRQSFEGDARNFEVMFVPSSGYEGADDDKPIPGTGQRVFSDQSDHTNRNLYRERGVYSVCVSRKASVNYYWDLLPCDVHSDSHPLVSEDPEWGVNLQLANNTTINWGPWCDRQRDKIWRFFNPISKQEWSPPTSPSLRQFRFHLEFSPRLDKRQKASKPRNLTNKLNLEFLGSNGHTKQLQLQAGSGSTIQSISPYFPKEVGDNGKQFHMAVKINLVDTKVTLESENLKRFVHAKELSVTLDTLTPTFFNREQIWSFEINVRESSLLFVWPIKEFMNEFINDWSPDQPLDLVHYVPVTYEFKIRFHHLEVLLPVNEYNYVDCQNPVPESESSTCKNSLLAIAVPELDVDFSLPFDTFAPASVEIVFNIQTRHGSIAIFVPPCAPAHHIQKASHKAQESFQRSLGQNRVLIYDADYWREITNAQNGFVELGSFNKLNLTFEYKWNCDYMPHLKHRKKMKVQYDPMLLEADFLRAKIIAEQIEPVAFGTLIPVLLNVKENVLGFWDQVTPFVKERSSSADQIVEINTNTVDYKNGEKDWIRPFRAFSVVVEVELRDLTARLPLPPNSALQNGGPLVKIDFLIFELDKHYTSTRMQLTLSEIEVTFGHKYADLHLSGLQYRGSAFFSAEGLPVTAPTLEYAWMQEIEVGKLSGEIKVEDIVNLALWLDQIILCVSDKASEFNPPYELKIGDEMKYEKTKVSFLGLDVTALCKNAKLKTSVARSSISINNLRCDERGGFICANLGAISVQVALCYDSQWLQAGLVQLPNSEIAVELGIKESELHEQDTWLRKHDRKRKRLNFLWESNAREAVYRTSLKDSWGCSWFDPDENSPAQVMLDGVVERGKSLIVDHVLVDLEQQFQKRPFCSRLTGTSIAHSTGSISPDRPFGRSSFRSSYGLLQPTESGDSSRIKSNSTAKISLKSSRDGSLDRPRAASVRVTGILKARTPENIAESTESSAALDKISIKSFKSFKSAKTTASSVTDGFHSALSSSFGSSDTIDQFYSADEGEADEADNIQFVEETTAAFEHASHSRNTSFNESILSNRTLERDDSRGSRRSRSKRMSKESSQGSSRVGQHRLRTESRSSRASVKNEVRRQRPSHLFLHTIASPIQADEDHEMYDKVLPILDENMSVKESSNRVCNGLVIRDAKRGVDFEPESPRVSQKHSSADRNATKLNITLNSVDNTSAVDVFATPLCLAAVRHALEDIEAVVQKLHYSTITTILMAKVVDEHMNDDDDLLEDRKSPLQLNFKIQNIKLGLCQVAQSINETGNFQKPMPCATLLIGWLEQVELSANLKENKNVLASASFRRLHCQLRANSIDGEEPERTTVVCLQETSQRSPKSVSVAFKCENDWGWIMAEAGVDGIKLKGERLMSKAQMNMNIEKVWFLAAAPSSLSRATRQWSLLSTASYGASSWVERLEDISNEISLIREDVISQRCKVIVAPLAHRVAMSESKGENSVYDYNIRKLIEKINDLSVDGGGTLPLTKSARALRKNVAFCAAASNVYLLSLPEFVKEIFRDGSDEAEYFLEPSNQPARSFTNLKIPKSQTLKRALLIVCQKWQKEMERYGKENHWPEYTDNMFDVLRMPKLPVENCEPTRRPTKVQTFNHNYSLPREGVESIIKMKSVLDYCNVPIDNDPETFTSLYKEEISQCKMSANLSSFQVFIKETEKRKTRRVRSFALENQPVLKLDQIKVNGCLDIPNTELEKLQNVPPKVAVSLDISEISQRLDMSLVRLIVQVNGVVDNIARAKMDHRIGRMEERCNDEHLNYPSSLCSSEDSIDIHQEINHQEQLTEGERSSRDEDPVWLVFVYNDGLNVAPQDTVEMEVEEPTITSRLARSTVIQAAEFHRPGGKFHSDSQASDLETETTLRVELSFSIRTTRLSADVGGLSLSIQLNALDGSVSLEQLKYVQEVTFDADNRVQPLRISPSLASLKLSVKVKLKSINIDFIEAQSTQAVLQVTVDRAEFNAHPNTRESQKVIDLIAEIGKVNLKLPLRVQELHHIFSRTSQKLIHQLRDFENYQPTIIETPDFDAPKLPTAGATTTDGQLSPQLGSESSKSSRSSTMPLIFKVVFKGFFMRINLLHSVTANYEVGPITSNGEWNPGSVKTTTGSSQRILMTSSLKVTEHKISILGEFRTADHEEKISQQIVFPSIEVDLDLKKDGSELLSGRCEIEKFQQELTTDLLNILLSCVEELKSEVTDILNKLKTEEPFPALGFQSATASTPKEVTPISPMKYSFKILMKGINVKASTPTGNIVKLDVPVINSFIANFDDDGTKSPISYNFLTSPADKIIINGDVELKLALICQEKKMASFDARVNIHNTNESAEDVLLVTLKSPVVFIHANAIDRAILVYLNYRSSYNVWKEEIEKAQAQSGIPGMRRGLDAQQQPIKGSIGKNPPHAPSRLFINLTVNDFKVKMPLIDMKHEVVRTNHVLLLTISHVNVCGTVGDLSAFKGKFTGFELLFDREGQPRDVKMNCCEVKEGGIEIVSGTEHSELTSNSRPDRAVVTGVWNLMISWNMMGLDGKFDTQIGTLFSRLGKTLTTFSDDAAVSEGSKARLKELRDKYNTGTKTLEDLKQLGATKSIIRDEEEALREIEKEFKKEYILLKRRPEPEKSQEHERQSATGDGEIELILNATITIKTGKLECYPVDFIPGSNAVSKKLDFVDERKRNSAMNADSSVTIFLLPALDVDLNYMSHGSGQTHRRAKLYSNVVIGSMPKEMSISPLFLEYLSQTLDFLDENETFTKELEDPDQIDLRNGADHIEQSSVQSFPVDVVVHAKVKPSTVLFSCQPKAKVECTLRVPLTNMVFSSAPSAYAKKSGLNLAIQLSDFALRVNHPYENSSKGCFHLNFEGISINILRQHVSEKLLTISVISDIGQANINYDMRRLSEILGFPKAWYNRSIARRLFLGESSRAKPANEPAQPHNSVNENWETAVRVSTVLRELRVDMNIGNVLGKTVWVTEQLAYHGAFDMRSSRKNDIKNVVSLSKTKIESRSGLLGGLISMCGFRSVCLWRERCTKDSAHEMKVSLEEVSLRLEYHSTVILLSKLSDSQLVVIDDSLLDDRPPRAKANCDMRWGEFDLLLCKSTSKNLVQGGRKVKDFVKQQINTGSEAFRTMFAQTSNLEEKRRGPLEKSNDDKYQRHWPPIFNRHPVASYQLGGESRLRGQELSIVCFDGDFRSADHWVVFSVHLPDISFSSGVYSAPEDDAQDRLNIFIFQTFIFNLGRAIERVPNFDSDKLGAFVLHVSRNKARRPGAQADVRDWIHYAVPPINEAEPEKSKENVHVIFALPQTEVTLKTEQIQPLKLPAFPEESKVSCVFVAEFHDQPLKVTMSTNEIIFLTNFVREYLREHKSVLSNEEMPDGDDDDPLGNSTDPRAYMCRTWKLDPLTRFMYKHTVLECPGVDSIIKQLGFKHAKLTIPKWFQRGLLDGLDSTHALFTAKLLDVYRKIKNPAKDQMQ